ETEKKRLGERVPEHRLQRRTGNRQASADQEREYQARRAQVAHNGAGVGVGVPEAVPNSTEWQRDRAEAEPEHDRDDPSRGEHHCPAAAHPRSAHSSNFTAWLPATGRRAPRSRRAIAAPGVRTPTLAHE